MIEHFNSVVRHCRDDFDFNAQVQAKINYYGMDIQLHYFVNDGFSALDEMLKGLCKLRSNRDLLKTFTHIGLSIIDRDDEESGETCYQIFGRHLIDGKGMLPTTIFAAAYGDLMLISLPSEADWKESGLEWVNTYCSYCCTDDFESMPWLGPQCECPNRTEGAGK